ncbi:MAG: hypothetical protein J4473_01990 [Candidatus Aenigmarchaeota archaeon]|nr:hypothetical protein [Candidatus Aenigmarchaeota archaeon]
MIEKYQYYLDNGFVRIGTSNKEEAISLIRKAVNRMNYIYGQKTDEKNAEFIFEDVYETVREASQSLMALKGHKPYSHEALISFLIEFYKFSQSDISTFDRYRILRNKCIYKGAKASLITCNESINFAKNFLLKIRIVFEKESGINI